MSDLIGVHRIDQANIGDLVSSPLDYFNFPDFKIKKIDLFQFNDQDKVDRNIIVGGGGLFDNFFLQAIANFYTHKGKGKLIAWGLGQQLDRGPWHKEFRNFDYKKFVSGFDLVGIRDYGFEYDWVPCASCMYQGFDKKRDIKHEFVVFSHKTRPIPITGFPALTNETNNLDEILDFLGSGETIITSSYHGMYWGLLLGRRVLAFPFNSKFFTIKHQPVLYPAIWFKRRGLVKRSSKSYRLRSCSGWRLLAGAAREYPAALEECRCANRDYYLKVIDLLNS